MSAGYTWSVCLLAMEAKLVRVEAHISDGLAAYNLVGLPDAAVREARDRVRSAVSSCFIEWPDVRVVLNLSPASLPKTGSGYDLAMAVAMLAAMQVIPKAAGDSYVVIGELGLDGRIIPVRGILPSVLGGIKQGKTKFLVPEANVDEAELVPGAKVTGVRHLGQVIELLGGELLVEIPPPEEPVNVAEDEPRSGLTVGDFSDIRGQAAACHAMEVAAAGGHHLLMVGTPGSGKTMLASRLPGILPPLSDLEAVAVTAIHSLAGKFSSSEGLIRRPPFQAPHHSATLAAMVGGGSGIPRPGAASLAHCGVLFLDEAPEFGMRVLDSLREPLESGEITLHRAAGAAVYPASFQLIMAANPCPCGNAGSRRLTCNCTPFARKRYLERLSGPLLDRMDIQIQVETPGRGALSTAQPADTTEVVARRVAQARGAQQERWKEAGWEINRQIPGPFLRSRRGGFTPEILGKLDGVVEKGLLSMRGAQRVLRLAWTVADLEGKTIPGMEHLGAAMSLRRQGAEIGNHGD
ncbi:YifB family Mg chelatase-like AAA ATPase [Mobiluncus porci]|uniref:YifB family Mg chelatase-like AAA ATPase n=1 Tax=Mobiluncus porci TaxID=2652278 RepID=A0A7K0K488_9ACTO|nr:YifB family Mg chelatase-like AAA ATPase [Mobiluncus porci]MST50254.1 YifB family Mg chelatase-like AAA ATPase [Mobiluncus porci]